MDCYYHGHSGSPGGRCAECDRENPPGLSEREKHLLAEDRRKRRERMENKAKGE